MNKPKTIFIILTVLVALALTAGTVGAASPALGLAAAPTNPAAPDAWETSFTFQGHLAQNGTPVNGKCDFKLNLWTDDPGGTNVGTPNVVIPNVTLVDGDFALLLDFGAGAFDGTDRYLEFQTRCPAGSGSYKMLGRVPILPTTSAMSLVPGAHTTGNGTIFTANSLNSDGLRGQTISEDYGVAGVHALAGNAGRAPNNKMGLYAESDTGYGIYGISDDDIGIYGVTENGMYAIYGVPALTNTINYGVYGGTASNAISAAGVFGEAAGDGGAYGVYGKTASEDSMSAGVFGSAGSTSLASNYVAGVYGESDDGHGVFGISSYQAGIFGVSEFGEAGVKGMSAATTGVTYGVQGISYSNAGHGGHFVNLDTSAESVQVGVWAGSFYNNPIEAHDIDSNGNSIDRVFYVSRIGEIYADGSVFTPAADFAEMLPAVEGLEPTDVLVIGLDGKLTKSTAAYQPTVVGVYSTNPGFVGGAYEDGNPEDEIPLAVVGVVPVKVSAENGAIQPGDMLVASDTPGHAMKADPDAPNGTVIGKALEPLDEGTGVILMLVVLQ